MEDHLYYYKATCDRVVDGDTLDLTVDLGMHIFIKERVRINGINTSEIYGVKKDSAEYAKGMLSKARTEELVLGKEIYIKTYKDKRGKYGRYICDIFVNGENVGDILVKEGHAEYKTY